MPDTDEEAQRRKASERPIDGEYPQMASEVRRLLGWEVGSTRPFLTTRMAWRKTGVNHATVSTMSKGDRPSYQSIEKFAEGLGADVNNLLLLAGYLPRGMDIQKSMRDEPKDEAKEGTKTSAKAADAAKVLVYDYIRRTGGHDNLKTQWTEEELEQLRKGTDMIIAGWLAENRRSGHKG